MRIAPDPLSTTIATLFLALVCAGCDRPYHGDLPKQSRIRGTQLIMTNYATAVGLLANDCGLEKLESANITNALMTNPGWQGWKGPYVPFVRGDLWERPMQFELTGMNFQILSAGPDQKFGTIDDVLLAMTTNILLQTSLR